MRLCKRAANYRQLFSHFYTSRLAFLRGHVDANGQY